MMKKSLLLAVPALLVLAGCGQAEEAGEPLSPQAQEALRTGNTGIPKEAMEGIKKGPPSAGEASARAADAKKQGK